MKRHRRDLEVLSDLNLTNLMDTAFILLIAFMLVAPMIRHGIELELPQVSRGPLQTESRTVTIVINTPAVEGGSDRIYVEDQRIDLADLRGVIEEKQATFEKIDIVVEADRDVRYEIFAQVMALLKNMDIENVGLATEPSELDAAAVPHKTP